MQIKLYHKERLIRRITIRPDSIIAALKSEIQRIEQIPVRLQTLTCGDYVLEDENRLKMYKLRDGSSVTLYLPITFKRSYILRIEATNSNVLSLQVNGMDSVAELKKRVEALTTLNVDYFSLFYLHQTLKDQNRLQDYDFVDNSFLRVVLNPVREEDPTKPSRKCGLIWLSFSIPYGLPIILNVELSSVIAETHDKLSKMLEIPNSSLHLEYKRVVMNIKKTFSDYRVCENDSIDLVQIPIYQAGDGDDDDNKNVKSGNEDQNGEEADEVQLIVRATDGGLLMVKVRPDTPFGRIKQRLEHEISKTQTNLYFKNVLLSKRQTPKDLNMRNGAVVVQIKTSVE